MVLFDGNDSTTPNGIDADGWNVNLSGITYTSGSAAITLHVSDGQTFTDDALVLNASTLVDTGGIFQGDSVPFGTYNGDGHLWDIKTYDITSHLSPGPNSLAFTTGEDTDCLSLVVAAIDLPAGAAPNAAATPTATPSSSADPTPSPTRAQASSLSPSPTPPSSRADTGSVLGEVGAPGFTAPPTDGRSGDGAAPSGVGWRLILLAMIGLIAATRLLTPDRVRIRRDRH